MHRMRVITRQKISDDSAFPNISLRCVFSPNIERGRENIIATLLALLSPTLWTALQYAFQESLLLSILDTHLPSMRTVRTSALIKLVALKQAAREARLGGEPVHTTEDFSSDVLQQEIFTPFKYAPWPSQAVNISSLNGS